MSSRTATAESRSARRSWHAEGLDLTGDVPGPRKAPHRRSILLSQSAVVAIFALAVAMGLVDRASLMSPVLFAAGAFGTVLVLAACCLLPWGRIPGRFVILVPIVDLLCVAVSRVAAGEGLNAVGLVAAFPVVWIAATRIRTRTAVLLTAVPSFGMIWLSLALDKRRVDVDAAVQPFLLPILLTGLVLLISVLTQDNRARQEELLASQDALRQSLEAGKDRERLLNAVFETVDVGVLAVDADGHDVLMNAKLREGHAATAPPGNSDPTEAELLIFEPDRVTPMPAEERPVRRAVLGENLDAFQVWVGTGRSQRALSITSRSMHHDDGALAGTVVSFHEVTELILALQAKDDFLSNVSHEFRTPLTSILGFLDLSLEEELTEEMEHNLQVIRRNVLRLERLVEDLLAINAGTFEVSPVPTDVGRVLEEATASSRPRADRAGVRLRNRAPSSLPAVVDPVRLAQAVDNLLSNAVKYNRRGGTITLDAFLDAEGLTVRVEDTGIGIEEEELHHVFDRFFRSPSVRTSTVPGVGLGLVITKSIISEHGGTITVSSEPGKGSCFTLHLPQPAH